MYQKLQGSVSGHLGVSKDKTSSWGCQLGTQPLGHHTGSGPGTSPTETLPSKF